MAKTNADGAAAEQNARVSADQAVSRYIAETKTRWQCAPEEARRMVDRCMQSVNLTDLLYKSRTDGTT